MVPDRTVEIGMGNVQLKLPVRAYKSCSSFTVGRYSGRRIQCSVSRAMIVLVLAVACWRESTTTSQLHATSCKAL